LSTSSESSTAKSAPAVGRWAEDTAAAFLESKGCRILSRNFRTRAGEIDLVAEEGETLVLVEVKYRSDEAFAPAEEAWTASKRKKVLKAGRWAAARWGRSRAVRFDLIVLVGPPDRAETRHYSNVIEGVDL